MAEKKKTARKALAVSLGMRLWLCALGSSLVALVVYGLTLAHDEYDLARALMEGVAFSLRDCYRTLEEMRLEVKRIFLIGGGARSKLWSEIVANVFNCSVTVPTPGDASFGACLLAGTGIGVFRDVRDAVAKCLHVDRTIAPDPAAAAKYDHLYTCYKRIHDALAPVYSQRKNP